MANLLREYIRELLEFSVKANRKNVHQDGTSKSRGYMSGIDKTWTGEDTNDHLHSWYKEMGLMSEALLTESTIDPKIMRMIDKADEYGFEVEIESNRVIVYGPGGKLDDIRAKINFEKDTSFGPCLNGAYVTYAKAEGGFGPLAYDVAIEATGGLMSDRTEVSTDAAAVWDYYVNNRSDIKVDQLDILEDYEEEQLTPDDKSDDCEQVPAHFRHKSDWHTSSLSKKISKSGTPVIDELEARNMIYDARKYDD